MVWGWCEARYERYNGCFLTRAEAIEEGRACCPKKDFWVAEGFYDCTQAHLPTAGDILEMMADSACDDVEDPDGWPDATAEAEAELNRFLEAWAEKHVAEPKWWLIAPDDDPELIRAGEFDFNE
ncbi:hypothetical protein DRQ25_05305 [Candidatus Fermentibacteria bacterium]|nr:MAG: hypothetical protein DRQ25_05305 [Candidatus Fermentibacteria bacterium]